MNTLWARFGTSTLFCGAVVLASMSAQAAGRQYFAVGGGGGDLTQASPCPDIPCNTGDVCTCVTASGNLDFSSTTSTFPSGTYTLEVSADNSAPMPNGSGGACYGSSGHMQITTPKGTLNLNFAGPACRLGMGGGGPDAVPFGISSAIVVTSGTGGYTNPIGTGTLAASFDPVGKTSLIDLVGYGVLVRKSAASQ